MVVLLDGRDNAATPLAEAWSPAQEPSDAALAWDAALELLRTPAEQWRAVRALLRRPRQAVDALRTTVAGTLDLGRELRPTPTVSIEGSIGPHRRWAVARASLDELREIRRVFGVTVNDVVVSVIAGAFRDLLLERGEEVDGVVLRSLVPVSVRAADDRTPNNQVSAMIASLPVGVTDPVERLRETHRELDALKRSHQAEAGEVITSMAGLTPATLYTVALRSVTAAVRRIPQRSVHTVTTNVPGPQHPLYAMGREMVEYLPFVPLAQGVRLGVAILSYNGQVRFGVTGDYDTVPEVEWFCRRIEANIAELAERAGADVAPRRRRRATVGTRDSRRAVHARRDGA
jgi:diacylglycerol O-acyltransferase